MSKVLCDHCGKESDNLSAAGAGLYCEHCGEPSEKGEKVNIASVSRLNVATANPEEFRVAQRTEFEAWRALMTELRKRGVDDINKGGKDESLHDAMRAWAEELVQLRLHDPNTDNVAKELRKRREAYLGTG
jgi:hypothetical protein